MKCWCFNEEQLERALKDYPRTLSHVEHELVLKGVVDFLNSSEAREHKLGLETSLAQEPKK